MNPDAWTVWDQATNRYHYTNGAWWLFCEAIDPWARRLIFSRVSLNCLEPHMIGVLIVVHRICAVWFWMQTAILLPVFCAAALGRRGWEFWKP